MTCSSVPERQVKALEKKNQNKGTESSVVGFIHPIKRLKDSPETNGSYEKTELFQIHRKARMPVPTHI